MLPLTSHMVMYSSETTRTPAVVEVMNNLTSAVLVVLSAPRVSGSEISPLLEFAAYRFLLLDCSVLSLLRSFIISSRVVQWGGGGVGGGTGKHVALSSNVVRAQLLASFNAL